MQRVNFNYLGATALERLGRFYNVPEAHHGCPLDELAYAVATAFMREVPFCALAPPDLQIDSSSVHCCDAAKDRHLPEHYSHAVPLCSAKVLWRQLTVEWLAVEGCR